MDLLWVALVLIILANLGFWAYNRYRMGPVPPPPPGQGPAAGTPGAPLTPGGPQGTGGTFTGTTNPRSGMDQAIREYSQAKEVLLRRGADVKAISAADEAAQAADKKGDRAQEWTRNQEALEAAKTALMKSYSDEYSTKGGANSKSDALKSEAESLIKGGELKAGTAKFEEALKALTPGS